MKNTLVVMVSLWVAVSLITFAESSNQSASNEIESMLIEEAYKRSQWMIRASHILVALAPDATNFKQTQALKRITQLRQSILEGRSFASVALASSDDPTVQESAGDLGYFTIFEQLYPIETAAFETPVGAISQPVRTRFGYHIIQTTERMSIRQRKRVSHLLIEDSSTEGYQRALKLLGMVEENSFESLVARHSDDPLTKTKGGDLGFDRLVNALEKVRLSLELHQVSQPIKSEQGWHLLKVTELAEIQSFQGASTSLKTQIQLDSRVERIRDAVSRGDRLYPVARAL